ncbi:MAG TPA: type II secretion system F family protein [Candidatus Babeliales bacterium]|nr:type II secretion system F family protein [Candidatus Babeliales bacterium]
MALFAYQALAKNGKRVTGTVDAPTVDAARDWIIKNGLYPIDIKSTTNETAGQSLWQRVRGLFSRVSFKDKILFTKQLAVLLKSGVPLLQAFELLVDQFQGRMRTILVSVRDDLKEGKSLAEGLGKYPKVFDNIYVQLVRAGEASGKLETILDRLVEYMERRQAIVKKVKGALTYPLIQLVMMIAIVGALVTFVLPNLVSAFGQDQALPATTRFLLAISTAIRSYYLVIIGVVIVLIFAYRWFRSTASGGRIIDGIKLKLPIIGYFTQMGAVVQFSRTLGMLLESGVNLSDSLDIVVKVIDNRVLKDALSEARDKIIKQGKISEYLKQTNIFPPIATYLINTGEQSGQLDFMLLTIAKNYEDDLAEYANTLSTLLEPIMLVIMAISVGFVVMSVIQPILGVTQKFNI